MTTPISDLTYKIAAFADVQDVHADDAIDWAVEMIELGYESRSLGMLASLSKPANYFEVIGHVKEAVTELGLKMKRGDAAVLSYASYYVHQILRGDRVRENLTELYKFCRNREYEDLVYDFYLLYWAWDHLDFEDGDHNHYWDGARRNNIEEIVVREAEVWIEANRKYYAQV